MAWNNVGNIRGPQGTQGLIGPIGPAGPPNNLSIGTVTTENTSESIDSIVAGLFTNSNTFTTTALNSFLNNRSNSQFVADVTKYGAKGDNGITDNKIAITAALTDIKNAGGGILFFPPGIYWWSGAVVLVDNLFIWGPGATLAKKYSTDANYCLFLSMSKGTTGYGSGVKNVYVSGLKFKGDFSATGKTACAFALHHADNVTVENCIFEEMHGQGHIFDLGGCSNITIKNCKFFGFKSTGGGYARVEAIQIDISSEGSLSGPDDAGSFDGLPTINVLVDNNKFLPLTVGGTYYPASNPIGSHSISTWHENITFSNNLVVDISIDNTSVTPGAIHFITARNLRIINNTFIQSTVANNPRMISLYSVTKAAEATAVETTMSISDVWIENNRFKGFASLTTEAMIRIAPLSGSVAVAAKNVHITGNTFEYASGTAASILISGSYIENLFIRENIISGATRVFNIGNVSDLKFINNTITGARADACWGTACTGVIIQGNQFKQSATGSVWFGDSFSVSIIFNKIFGTVGGTRVLGLSNTSKVDISHNEIEAPSGTYGIHLYTNTSNGFVTRNIISGGTTTHLMYTSAVNITPDNNITL